jgi:hypothetical protein
VGPDHLEPRLDGEELHDGHLVGVGVEVDVLAQHDLDQPLDHRRAGLAAEFGVG